MSEETWHKDSVVTRTTSINPTWEKKESSPEERVFRHCFHHRDTCEIVEEAENVIILHEKKNRPHQPDEGVLHVWVYTRSNWSSCYTTSPSVWNNTPMPERMARLQETLRFLKGLAQ